VQHIVRIIQAWDFANERCYERMKIKLINVTVLILDDSAKTCNKIKWWIEKVQELCQEGK
jgi:hypothetical protein